MERASRLHLSLQSSSLSVAKSWVGEEMGKRTGSFAGVPPVWLPDLLPAAGVLLRTGRASFEVCFVGFSLDTKIWNPATGQTALFAMFAVCMSI